MTTTTVRKRGTHDGCRTATVATGYGRDGRDACALHGSDDTTEPPGKKKKGKIKATPPTLSVDGWGKRVLVRGASGV